MPRTNLSSVLQRSPHSLFITKAKFIHGARAAVTVGGLALVLQVIVLIVN